MKNIQLRQLIRESINDYIREIDEAGNVAALEAKMNKTEEAINKRKKMVAMEGLDEDMKGMIDEKKVKDINAEIKALEKSLVKYGKQLEKLKSKGEKVAKSEDTEEKEIVDEVTIDEDVIDENTEYESDKDNPYAIRKKNPDAKFYFTHKGKEDFEDEKDMSDEDDNSLNEAQMLHMQKLAGIISETEYKKRINEAASKMQLFKSLDKKNLNNEKLNDLNYVKKLIDDILDKEYDTVADNPEALAKEYINSRKNKIEEAKKKPSAGLTKKQKSAVSKKAHAGKDIGKKGKGFEKVAKAAEKQYGSKEAGERVAAAAMWKSIKRK